MAFLDVTDETFDEEVLASEVPVLAHFTAPWCHPCKTVEARLVELESAAAGRVRLVRLDIDADLGVPSRYGVLTIPTVIVFADGEPHERIVGLQPRRRYQAVLDRHLA
ncbi:MAG TPA: thioredoxin domain-containing protein [Gaiella sp.]|jgi:thioredoxin 1